MCGLVGLIWAFEDLTGGNTEAQAQRLQQDYSKEICNEIYDNTAFKKKTSLHNMRQCETQ